MNKLNPHGNNSLHVNIHANRYTRFSATAPRNAIHSQFMPAAFISSEMFQGCGLSQARQVRKSTSIPGINQVVLIPYFLSNRGTPTSPAYIPLGRQLTTNAQADWTLRRTLRCLK